MKAVDALDRAAAALRANGTGDQETKDALAALGRLRAKEERDVFLEGRFAVAREEAKRGYHSQAIEELERAINYLRQERTAGAPGVVG